MALNTIQNARIELSRKGIRNNYEYYHSFLNPSTKILILVKADSYGIGALEFTREIVKCGIDYLAVAFPDEGIRLRKNGIHLPIMVLTAGDGCFDEIIRFGLEPGIPNIESMQCFEKAMERMGNVSYPVHIKLDTGMHRLGFMENELPPLIGFLEKHPEIHVKSIYSHLSADADPECDGYTMQQFALFERMSGKIMRVLPYKPMLHILNSAGIERFPQFQYDMVRLGIGIYGISDVAQDKLSTVTYLRCPIIQIKTLTGEDGPVGYDRKGILPPGIHKTATIPLGYADGINRHFGCGKACFELNGKLVPTIGNICMDMTMLDITGMEAKVGDTVTIFGNRPTVSELADILGTIPYEIFTSLSRRLPRNIID
ncbi:MAG: alanine racemase [Bacteroidales bacterium]|jgi:alanine racemase|nr:alanine racemase [Bacteroidales bacterium]MCI2121293.1 alanine racemase [Bacteroidales bacterium]MCI2145217.1 alanine racemase [Bacteroidales bacterium]